MKSSSRFGSVMPAMRYASRPAARPARERVDAGVGEVGVVLLLLVRHERDLSEGTVGEPHGVGPGPTPVTRIGRSVNSRAVDSEQRIATAAPSLIVQICSRVRG